MKERQAITEKDNIHQQWYLEARKVTAETLPAFIDTMINGYKHDYGTICHAIAAAALAGAYAVESSPTGGITGFQGGAVMWEFITQWNYAGQRKALRLVEYDNLLYPQYEDYFTTISSEVWKATQEKAAKNIENKDCAAPAVMAHWKRIASGEVPFGLKVETSKSTPTEKAE